MAKDVKAAIKSRAQRIRDLIDEPLAGQAKSRKSGVDLKNPKIGKGHGLPFSRKEQNRRKK